MMFWPFRSRKITEADAMEKFCADMQDILAIEYECFDSPWDDDDFMDFLGNGGFVQTVNDGTNVVGYACLSRHRKYIEVENIAVRPDKQRQGLGRGLMGEVARHLLFGQRLVAFISERNMDAQLFFSHIGFKATRVKREYYADGADAFVFQYKRRPEQGNCHGKNERVA
jgi:ribosomal protein S18 acetylase RimI-like enzyme